MKNLYLVRHGETLFNQRWIIQGIVNSPLVLEGVAQALHTKTAYFEHNKITYDHVFCSPEGRCIQTTELLTSQPYVTVKALHEMNFGKLEGCPAYLLAPQKDFSWYYGSIGGETTAQVELRMDEALHSIMNHPENQNVLVVAHGAANQCFYDVWKKNNQCQEKQVLQNCSVLHYTFDPQTQEFTLRDIFNEDYQTEDLAAAKACNQGLDF